MFQHTAARRRLAIRMNKVEARAEVSTHSRPKAAGQAEVAKAERQAVSTHSRPKAAGVARLVNSLQAGFQHTAARRRLD